MFLTHFSLRLAVGCREDFLRTGYSDCVSAYHRDVCLSGFPSCLSASLDGIFLDLPTPWTALPHAHEALKDGGRVVCFSPCIEQTQKTCVTLKAMAYQQIATYEVIVNPWGVTIQSERLQRRQRANEERTTGRANKRTKQIHGATLTAKRNDDQRTAAPAASNTIDWATPDASLPAADATATVAAAVGTAAVGTATEAATLCAAAAESAAATEVCAAESAAATEVCAATAAATEVCAATAESAAATEVCATAEVVAATGLGIAAAALVGSAVGPAVVGSVGAAVVSAEARGAAPGAAASVCSPPTASAGSAASALGFRHPCAQLAEIDAARGEVRRLLSTVSYSSLFCATSASGPRASLQSSTAVSGAVPAPMAPSAPSSLSDSEYVAPSIACSAREDGRALDTGGNTSPRERDQAAPPTDPNRMGPNIASFPSACTLGSIAERYGACLPPQIALPIYSHYQLPTKGHTGYLTVATKPLTDAPQTKPLA
eukprot:GHVT01060190.1.p1 GENE.GHVT01060190.1~~GHVT01060190.1.p1  ORF type:complete len:489 (+),score=129.76 GHVT01060190.1:173-1639(+)